MKIKIILLLVFSGLVVSTGSFFGYRYFVNNFVINKKQVLGEQEILVTNTPTSSLTPTNTPIATAAKIVTPKPINTPIPTLKPIATPVVQINTNNNSNNSSDVYWANQPKDSQGVLCINFASRCKYECSIPDKNVDDFLEVLSKHIRNYQNCVPYFGANSSTCKSDENAAMSVYNTVYDYCINSPIFHPQSPL